MSPLKPRTTRHNTGNFTGVATELSGTGFATSPGLPFQREKGSALNTHAPSPAFTLEQPGDRYAVKIRCACGQEGVAFWEGGVPYKLRSPAPVLFEVSSGFYLRGHDKNSGMAEIACAVCESVVLNLRSGSRTMRTAFTRDRLFDF